MSEPIERLSLTEQDLKTGIGVLHQHSVPETYRIHTHDFYELFLVPRGKAIHLVNGNSQFLSEGSFVLIRPDDIHKYDFFNNYDFEIINIGFPRTMFAAIAEYMGFAQDIFIAGSLPPHSVLSGHMLHDVKWKLLQIDKIKDSEHRYAYIRSIMPYFLQIFRNRQLAIQRENKIPRWFTDLLHIMSLPENYIAGLPKLIESANMSQEYLNRAFRRYINMTPTEYINIKRVNHAAQLLLGEEKQIIDICAECGFNNLSHFYRIFGRQFGCSPKKFLAEHTA